MNIERMVRIVSEKGCLSNELKVFVGDEEIPYITGLNITAIPGEPIRAEMEVFSGDIDIYALASISDGSKKCSIYDIEVLKYFNENDIVKEITNKCK